MYCTKAAKLSFSFSETALLAVAVVVEIAAAEMAVMAARMMRRMLPVTCADQQRNYVSVPCRGRHTQRDL